MTEKETDGLRRYFLNGPEAGETALGRIVGIYLWYRTWLMIAIWFSSIVLVGIIQGDVESYMIGLLTFMLISWVYP